MKNILVIPRDANVKAFAFLKNSHFVHSYIKCSGLTKHFRAFLHMQEAVVRRCSVKKVFLEISQNSQENTCAKISF